MRIDGYKFTFPGLLVGVILFELYHKSRTGRW